MQHNLYNKALGSFRGLAIGDALGAPAEFHQKGTFDTITHYLPTHFFGLEAGQWTDDTIMSLCLAESLIECNGYDSYNVMNKYVQWCHHGYNSPNGKCFDIGIQTMSALNNYELNPTLTQKQCTDSAGNGVTMKLAPAAIVSTNLDKDDSNDLFCMSAIDTHYGLVASESTILFGFLLRNLMNGIEPDEAFSLAENSMNSNRMHVGDIVKNIDNLDPVTSGYVVTSMQTAWWAFRTTDNFRDAVLKAVNLGGDADTIAAMTGQLAGAYYGNDDIDDDLKNELYQTERFENLTHDLLNIQNGVVRHRLEQI